MDSLELAEPLEPADVVALEVYLELAGGAPSLPYAEGFLAAVLSAPTTIKPSQWLPMVLGERSLKSDEHVMGLVMRFYNQLARSLLDGECSLWTDLDHEFEPFCQGYLAGARLDPVWGRDEAGTAMLLPFGVLAGEFDLTGEEDAEGKRIEDPTAHCLEYQRGLPDSLLDLHDYWVDVRSHVAGTFPRPGGLRVGRNEPCPCGSGDKFKKCCGA